MIVEKSMAAWGRTTRALHRVQTLSSPAASNTWQARPALAFGNGRSYGETCLNPGGLLLDCRSLDHFLEWNPDTGIIRCEPGVLLGTLIERVLAEGWFPPVCPGTRWVTLGGALANDVHGKNHQAYGSFGDHVLSLELLRSDSSRHQISPTQNPELFAATIGGLGLTGLITSLTLQMRRVPGPWLQAQTLPFATLDEFSSLATESLGDWEYSVAWIDCAGRGRNLGRGLFHRARHLAVADSPRQPREPRLALPFTLPFFPLRGPLLRAFNSMVFHRPRPRDPTLRHYRPFFFPLDGVAHWNRAYGPSGFVQYQCVIPYQHSGDALPALVRRMADSGQGSPLAVLKCFADRAAPGMLSFPRAGVTLAVDFAWRGDETLKLLNSLDSIVAEADGALYPAKDSRMSRSMFEQSFPRLQEFLPHCDPGFASGFWQRIMENA